MATLRDSLDATDIDEAAKLPLVKTRDEVQAAIDIVDHKLVTDYKEILAGIEGHNVNLIVDWKGHKAYTIDPADPKGYAITEPPGVDDVIPPPVVPVTPVPVVPPVIPPVVPVIPAPITTPVATVSGALPAIVATPHDTWPRLA